MKYQYHDMQPSQLEDLVIGICEELFGIGVQGFTDGVDGGRDARFEGVAQIFPSTQDLWSGITIIQAKHTNGINRSFSESDFFGNKTAQIDKEILKVKKLYDNHEINNYILFANRKLTANKNEEILNEISTKTGLLKKNIHLVGLDSFERYLKKFPNALNSANLSVFDEPLKITPDELAEIIVIFASNKNTYFSQSDFSKIKEIKRKEFPEKNLTNKLSDDYAKLIKRHMFKDGHYDEITSFLSHPDNIELKNMYEETVEEFNTKIIIYGKEYESFEKILDYMYDRLISRDPDLRKNKRLTRVFIHYMYYFCDIG
ncbi:MAG: hypothetical protein MJK08_14575 [Campylobacterales bacterium]|nr:hypothetical protein [Campylobacterales bacterium]